MFRNRMYRALKGTVMAALLTTATMFQANGCVLDYIKFAIQQGSIGNIDETENMQAQPPGLPE